MPENTASSDATKTPPRLTYIHPKDLLLTRLRGVAEDAGDLVDITLANYELYYYRQDGQSICSHKLRENAYCNPSEKVYPKACKALKLAVPAAVGIGEWLRWGMDQRAGTFETEVRGTLAALHADVNLFPALALVPVLEALFARWEPNLDKLAQLEGELGHAAVESRDPAEWNLALHGAFRTVELLDEAFVAYCSAAKDPTADLTEHYEALIGAMAPLEEKLVEIGPRLLYAFDYQEEAQRLVEHIPHWLTQCAGSLSYWRRQERSPKRPRRELSAELPSEFRDAWKYVLRLGDYIAYALRAGETEPSSEGKKSTAQLAGAVSEGANVPIWDEDRRELWFHGKLCRRFARVAPSQMELIRAFSTQGWPRRIESPMDPDRLHDTLENMKSAMEVIRFLRDGDGRGIRWERI